MGSLLVRHTQDLHVTADGTVGTPIGTPAGVAGSLSAASHDEQAGPPRLSKSEITGELCQIKRIIRARGKRNDHFDSNLFADPAWDILLNLAQAEIEHRRTTISDLCHAACVPATTALRWINSMTTDGKLLRRPDAFDGRRVYISLSPESSISMRQYLRALQG